MDNFRKFNSSRNMPNAVDGFIGAGRKPVPRRPVSSRAPLRTSQQSPGGHIDSFRKSDGFRPAAQPMIRTSAAAPKVSRHDVGGAVALDMPATNLPRRKRGKKKVSRLKKVFRSVAILFIVLLLGIGFLFGKGYLKARNVFKGGGGAAALEANVDPSKLNGEGDGRVNILLLGKGGEGHEAPDLTDTILIASIDPVQNEAAILSIPRDMWVKGEFGSSKINAVYANAKYAVLAGKREPGLDVKAEEAGLAAIEKTVEDTMGIPIHYHGLVDFTAFQQAIDAVGGVDIDVKTALFETMYINGKNYNLDVKVGPNHFDGFRGLAYSRSRHTSLRGDFDRSERQREILIALKTKVLSVGTFSNPNKISQLIDAFGDHVQTNLSLSEMLRVFEIGKNIPSDKIASLSFVDPPNVLVTTDSIEGQSVVVPKAGIGNYTAIQSFVRNALKDAFLKQEDATIAVYNGTNTNGLASVKADELRSFGYNIATVANAPTKNYPKTVIVDLRNGAKRYTKNYLEKRFGVTAVTSMPDSTIDPGTSDFVIILGSDVQ